MTRLYWIPLNVPDFFADTGLLTSEERGALIYIMCAVWRSPDGWISDNDEDLARFTATGNRWRYVKKRIAPLLMFEGGWITHKATQDERVKATEISQRRKAAADARWRKANGRGDASAYANDDANGMTTTTTTTNTDTGEEAYQENKTRDGEE